MKNLLRHRQQPPALPMNTAEQMLANVFTACSREQNTIPLEVLTSYSNYRKERYTIQRTLIVLILLLFMLLPVLFLYGDIHITPSNPSSAENPAYHISIDTAIPIRRIQARIDGQTVPIYEISENEYMIQPGKNGQMSISVMLVNRQYTSVDLQVSGVDAETPQLVSTESDDACVYLYVSDEMSGVNYNDISVTDPDGSISAPVNIDVDAGCITLSYPDRPMNICIPDMRGNVLRIELTPQKIP